MGRQILNNSKILGFILALFLTFLLVSDASSNQQKELDFKVVIEPKEPVQGDTVSVKVTKVKGLDSRPKVYLNKTKLPVFDVDDVWYRSFFPITANQKVGNYTLDIFYGDKKKNLNLSIKEKKFRVEEITFTKEVSALRPTRIEKVSVAQAINTVSETKYWNNRFTYPSSGKRGTEYGVKRRINGVLNPDYFHKGLDFSVPAGSVVKAPADGKVILAGEVSKGFVVNGNCIFIDHGHGVISAYLHLSQILVKDHDMVKKGQIIGKVGSTGIVTGPHLHWGIYVAGKPVDPDRWVQNLIE